MYRSLSIALAFVLTAAAGAVVAQYPVKPIRLIVGFPPGGSADPTTRIMAAALRSRSASRWWSRTVPAPTARSPRSR